MSHRTSKTFLYLFVLVLFSISVMSLPPVLQSTTATTLTVIYPQENIFLIGRDVDLHFHIVNGTGYMLFNNQSTCMIHVYNTTNKHIYNQTLGNDGDNIYDKDIYINGTKLRVAGTYSYNIWCNSSTQAGFLSSAFTINESGTDTNNTIKLVIVLGILGTIFILLYFAFKLSEEHELLKTILSLFSIFLLALIPFYLLLMEETTTTQLFYKIYIYFIWILTAYIFIYFMMKVFYFLADRWKQK